MRVVYVSVLKRLQKLRKDSLRPDAPEVDYIELTPAEWEELRREIYAPAASFPQTVYGFEVRVVK